MGDKRSPRLAPTVFSATQSIAGARGGFLTVDIDRSALSQGFVIPIDRETGRPIGNVFCTELHNAIDQVTELVIRCRVVVKE